MNETNNNNKDSDNVNKAPLSGIQPGVFIILSLFVVFVTYQIFGGVLSILIYGKDFKNLDSNITVARIVISFSQFMFILIPVILLNMLQGNKPKLSFRLNKPKVSVLWLGILGVIIVQPALQVYLFLQNLFLKSLPFGGEFLKQIKDLMDSLEATTLNLVTAQSVSEFILVAFVIAVTPAICEEFFFRGLIFHNFEKVMLKGKAIFMTGFIFAIFHFHPFNLIPLILLGFYLTYVVYYSKSILTGIVVHFVNNFLSAYLVFKYGKEGLEDPNGSLMDNLSFIISGVVSIILFLIILKIIKNKGSETKSKIVVNV